MSAPVWDRGWTSDDRICVCQYSCLTAAGNALVCAIDVAAYLSAMGSIGLSAVSPTMTIFQLGIANWHGLRTSFW
jgi:hypothetical protein